MTTMTDCGWLPDWLPEISSLWLLPGFGEPGAAFPACPVQKLAPLVLLEARTTVAVLHA